MGAGKGKSKRIMGAGKSKTLRKSFFDYDASNGDKKAGLLGLENSNRDFNDEASWGKNQFNNAFPIALLNYMGREGIKPMRIAVNANGKIIRKEISVQRLFGGLAVPVKNGKKTSGGNIHFEFENSFAPYEKFLSQGGALPVNDVVISKLSGNGKKKQSPFRPLEIKLTTLPDAATAGKTEDLWGCELVVRQPTITAIALSLIEQCDNEGGRRLCKDFIGLSDAVDWSNFDSEEEVKAGLEPIREAVNKLLERFQDHGTPLLVQPVWRTEGQSTILSDNCFDVFVWDDHALAKMISERSEAAPVYNKNYLSRPGRSLVWLAAMLGQYAETGKINPEVAISQHLAGAKTDKAFAMNGSQTLPYMRSQSLAKPRITKTAAREIILGSGENFLKPERRLDAVLGIAAVDDGIFEN